MQTKPVLLTPKVPKVALIDSATKVARCLRQYKYCTFKSTKKDGDTRPLKFLISILRCRHRTLFRHRLS